MFIRPSFPLLMALLVIGYPLVVQTSSTSYLDDKMDWDQFSVDSSYTPWDVMVEQPVIDSPVENEVCICPNQSTKQQQRYVRSVSESSKGTGESSKDLVIPFDVMKKELMEKIRNHIQKNHILTKRVQV